MDRPLIISDRLTAAGFRLAGMETLVSEPDKSLVHFRQALEQSRPVLITADLAARIPAPELALAISRAQPVVAVIPDISGHGVAPDMGGKVRHALGVET